MQSRDRPQDNMLSSGTMQRCRLTKVKTTTYMGEGVTLGDPVQWQLRKAHSSKLKRALVQLESYTMDQIGEKWSGVT